MRKGFELAYTTAYLFCRSHVRFFAMDDVTFYKPVEIGDILTLDACITYTSRSTDADNSAQQNFLQVEIVANVTNPKIGEKHMTNTFNFTFLYPENSQPLLRIVPQTYEEAMKYLEGKRRVDRHLEFLKEIDISFVRNKLQN